MTIPIQVIDPSISKILLKLINFILLIHSKNKGAWIIIGITNNISYYLVTYVTTLVKWFGTSFEFSVFSHI